MSLVSHAEEELRRAGLFDADSDYGGELGRAALEIVKVFASQGHSGGSASVVIPLVTKLLRFEPLTPITSDPSEWMQVADEHCQGGPFWQSTRKSTSFSRDGGKTWWDLDDEEETKRGGGVR